MNYERSQREAVGLSQIRLARLAGVSRFRISIHESADGKLTTDEVRRIRIALHAWKRSGSPGIAITFRACGARSLWYGWRRRGVMGSPAKKPPSTVNGFHQPVAPPTAVPAQPGLTEPLGPLLTRKEAMGKLLPQQAGPFQAKS